MGAGPRVRCNNCNTVIQSRHIHYMDWCSCTDEQKAVAIDGGDAYVKISQGDKANYTFLSGDDDDDVTDFDDEPDLVELFDRLDMIVDEYEEWEEKHPPRRGKNAMPKHGVDGRSIFTIVETQIRKARHASK